VRISPLYHAITLIRSLTLGTVGPFQLVNAGYLVALGLAGIWLARKRMSRLLLT
jgi:lipooligosaccharide transport system permease protein